MSTTIILPNVRLSHPHLFVAQPPQAGSTSGPKFDGSFLFPLGSEQDKVAQQAFIAEAQKTFGANFQTIVGAMDKGKKCLRNGDQKLTKEGKVSDGYAGMRFLVAKNKMRPIVIAKRFFNGKPVHLDELGNTFVDGQKVDVGFPVKVPYGGCYVNAKVEVYAMNKPGLQGIYATLLAVQFHEDGSSFGGGAAPTADGFEEGEDGGGDYSAGAASGFAGSDAFGGAPANTAPPAVNLFG